MYDLLQQNRELREALKAVMSVLYNNERGGVYSAFRQFMEPDEISTIEKAKAVLLTKYPEK